MVYKLFLLSLIFAFCDSQEHLTCLRTDDVFSTPPAQPQVRIQQGPPGKRGIIGAKGSVGEKGSKGDSGVPDNSTIISLKENINNISNELTVLRQQVQNISELTRAGYYSQYKVLGDGWIALFNGYQYKTTPSVQSWQSSRTICRNLGADLAVNGVQNMEYIRILLKVFSKPPNRYWIGLDDRSSEGTWIWLNGARVMRTAVFWAKYQPDNYGNREDCGEIRGIGHGSWQNRVNDEPCDVHLIGLCERAITAN